MLENQTKICWKVKRKHYVHAVFGCTDGPWLQYDTAWPLWKVQTCFVNSCATNKTRIYSCMHGIYVSGNPRRPHAAVMDQLRRRWARMGIWLPARAKTYARACSAQIKLRHHAAAVSHVKTFSGSHCIATYFPRYSLTRNLPEMGLV